MIPRTYVFVAALIVFPRFAEAALIHEVNFTDGNWTVSLSEPGGAPSNNASGVTASTITANETGEATAAARIVVSLTGSISTVGFENISIAFFGDANGGLEWNADFSDPNDEVGDGIRIVGSGVEINANSLNDIDTGAALAEAEWDAGTAFPTANFGSDFDFDASVSNSSLTSLVFFLQVNTDEETVAISNVVITGDPISSPVPEPSTFLLCGLGSLGLLTMRRRRESAAA